MAEGTQELLIRVRAETREAHTAFIGLTKAGDELRESVTQQARAFGGANSAVQGFARLTNDAISFQYGFTQGLIATANQADQLVYAFGQMKAAAAASGATIRSQFLAALTGPNGVLLAINLITTAVAILGPRIAAAFDQGTDAADRARGAFSDALDELIKFQSASRTFTFQNQQQAEAGAAAARGEANAINERYQALQREQELLSARLRPGGPGGGVVGVTPEQARRLAELPGLISQVRDEWNDVYRVAQHAQAMVARYNAEARVAARAGGLGFPETPERPRAGGRGATGGRGAGAGAGGEDPLAPDVAGQRLEMAQRLIRRYAEMREEWQKQAKAAVGASIATNEYAAAVRSVDVAFVTASHNVTAWSVAMAEGIRNAQIDGVLTLVNGLSRAFGDLAALDLSGFADGIKQTMQDVVRSVAAAIAQALLLRAVLAGLNLIAPGLGSGLGTLLGVPGIGGNAVAAGAALSVTFGGASYRDGGIYIPAAVTAASVRDYDNRQAGRGRTR
jgi:hypothetical protein